MRSTPSERPDPVRDVHKVGWVLVEEGRLLVARNRGRNLFYLPGGRREVGESDARTLVREVGEELSVRVDPATMKHVGTFVAARDDSQGCQGSQGSVWMTCYAASYAGELRPGHEIEELAWIGSGDGDLVTDAERQLMAALVRAGQLAGPRL